MFLKHGYGCIQKLEPKVNGGPLSCGAQKTFPDNVASVFVAKENFNNRLLITGTVVR